MRRESIPRLYEKFVIYIDPLDSRRMTDHAPFAEKCYMDKSSKFLLSKFRYQRIEIGRSGSV